MLRSLMLASVAIGALGGAALAADLPMRSAPPAPYIPPPPVFTWTGFYIGANAGYSFDNSARATVPGVVTLRNKSDGFTGGGQIGYNYQFGAGNGIVVGVEADAAYIDADKTALFGTPGNTVTRYHSSLDYLGTVRGRVGYAFDRFLVYGTGGFAYGGQNWRGNVFDGAGNNLGNLGFSNTGTGYAYGGGVEYALPTGSFLNFFNSSAVTLRAEYLHYDLGTTNTTLTSGANNVPVRFHDEGDLVRAGLNYKF